MTGDCGWKKEIENFFLKIWKASVFSQWFTAWLLINSLVLKCNSVVKHQWSVNANGSMVWKDYRQMIGFCQSFICYTVKDSYYWRWSIWKHLWKKSTVYRGINVVNWEEFCNNNHGTWEFKHVVSALICTERLFEAVQPLHVRQHRVDGLRMLRALILP